MQADSQNEAKITKQYFEAKHGQYLPGNQHLNNVKMEIQNKYPEEQINQNQGNFKLSQRIQRLQKNISDKTSHIKKQLKLLNQKLYHDLHSHQKKQAKSLHPHKSVRASTQLTEKQLKQYQKNIANSQIRLKLLKKSKQQARTRKILSQNKKKQREMREEKEIKQQQEMENQIKKKQKQEKIKLYISKIEDKKKQRLSRIKSSIETINSAPILPLYKRMEKEYNEKYVQGSILSRIKYNEKMMEKYKNFDRNSLREHEEKYLERVENVYKRNLSKSRVRTQEMIKKNQQKQQKFKIIGMNPEEIEQKRKGLLRVQKYQQSQSCIRIKTNIDKYYQIEIAKDKSKNPFKYHYLKTKKYSEKQIFNGFADFQFRDNGKKVGNQYLKKVNKNNSERVKSNLNSRVSTEPIGLQPPIKDYLKESKKMMSKKKINETQAILKNFNTKSQALQYLERQANKHSEKALQKIQNLNKQKQYSNSLKVEDEIDDEFLTAVKKKIKILQIN